MAQERPRQDSWNLAGVGGSRSGFLGGQRELRHVGHGEMSEVDRAFSAQAGRAVGPTCSLKWSTETEHRTAAQRTQADVTHYAGATKGSGHLHLNFLQGLVVAPEGNHWSASSEGLLSQLQSSLVRRQAQHWLPWFLRPLGGSPRHQREHSFLGNRIVSYILGGVAQERLAAKFSHGKPLHLPGLY